MRYFPLLLLPAAFAGLTHLSPEPPVGPPTRHRIESDLKLLVTGTGPRKLCVGGQPWLTLALVNRSRTTTYPIVKPGDGSECGWREPHVFFTLGTRNPDGTWTESAVGGGGRCGNFDIDWPRDVVQLKPGDRLPCGGWFSRVNADVQQPGPARVTAIYRYTAGRGRNEPLPFANERGAMADVPPFEIRSESVEFDFVRPLELRVRVKKPAKVGRTYRAADLVEVSLTRPGRDHHGGFDPQPMEGQGLRLIVQSAGAITLPRDRSRTDMIDYSVNPAPPEPGQTVELFRQGMLTDTGKVDELRAWSAGLVRVHAVYWLNVGGVATRIRSEQVSLVVEP